LTPIEQSFTAVLAVAAEDIADLAKGLPLCLAVLACRGLRHKRCRSAEHLVEMPPVGDAFQFVLAGVFELEP